MAGQRLLSWTARHRFRRRGQKGGSWKRTDFLGQTKAGTTVEGVEGKPGSGRHRSTQSKASNSRRRNPWDSTVWVSRFKPVNWNNIRLKMGRIFTAARGWDKVHGIKEPAKKQQHPPKQKGTELSTRQANAVKGETCAHGEAEERQHQLQDGKSSVDKKKKAALGY